MKEKKSIAQKVAELNQQQKSSVLKFGIIMDVIAIVLLIIALVIALPAYQDMKDARDNANEISEEILEQNDLILEESERLSDMGYMQIPELIPYDEADEAWEEADEASSKFAIVCTVSACVLIAFAVIQLVLIKVKIPYYSDGVFCYLLFGKDKKTMQ